MKQRPECCPGYQDTCDGCLGEKRVKAQVELTDEPRWIACSACGGTGLEWFHIDGCPNDLAAYQGFKRAMRPIGPN